MVVQLTTITWSTDRSEKHLRGRREIELEFQREDYLHHIPNVQSPSAICSLSSTVAFPDFHVMYIVWHVSFILNRILRQNFFRLYACYTPIINFIVSRSSLIYPDGSASITKLWSIPARLELSWRYSFTCSKSMLVTFELPCWSALIQVLSCGMILALSVRSELTSITTECSSWTPRFWYDVVS